MRTETTTSSSRPPVATRIPVGFEVSCRAVEPYLAIAHQRGVSLDRLVEGLGVDAKVLTSGSKSMSWDDFCLLSDRVHRLVQGDDGMRLAGTRVMDAPMLRAFSRVVALFADVQRVYAASDNFSRTKLFRCLDTTFEVDTPTRIRTEVRILEPYRGSRPFFWFLAGVFQATPRVVGLPDAVVQVDVDARSARYVIDHAPSTTLWRRVSRVFHILFSARDTLEELQLQNQQLMAQLAEVADARLLAEHTSKLKSEFLANVSHELRTPLNPVVAAADALGDRELDAESIEDVRMIQDGGRRMVEVVDQLLTFADLDAGSLKLERIPFDLSVCLDGLEAQMRPLAEAKGLDLVFDVDGAIPRSVLGDRRRIREVLANLLDNAVRFTEQGGVELHAHREPGHDGEVGVRFEVRDTGPGISQDLQEELFEPFRQRDGSLTRGRQGLGLGLTIAQQLMHLMDGRLELKSESGSGCVFVVHLSLRPASTRDREATRSDPHLPAHVEPAPAPAPALAAPQRRVLVVEDDKLSQRLLSRMVASVGCAVDVANDGVEAVEAAEAQDYDLVFMDCQMPRMDGLEATRRIRGMPGTRGRTPVVAVTAHAVVGHREQCLACGMDEYLTKPIDRARITQMLERFAPLPLPALDAGSAQSVGERP